VEDIMTPEVSFKNPYGMLYTSLFGKFKSPDSVFMALKQNLQVQSLT